MRIAYLASMRLPTERAHGVQIMAMCEAFAEAGHDVMLLIPNRATHLEGDPFAYYGVKQNFAIERVSVLDTVSWGKLGFIAYLLSFGMQARGWLKGKQFDVIFSRDEVPLDMVAAKAGGAQLVWESHRGAWNRWVKLLLRKGAKVIVISEGLKAHYEGLGLNSDRMLVAHDAVASDALAASFDKDEVRNEFQLPKDKMIVMYAGSLEEWKGYRTLLEASQKLPSTFKVVIVGGKEEQVASLKKEYPDVTFLGYFPSPEIPKLQAAADILVIPNTAKGDLSSKFTSPLKVFSSMASKVPIVASDIPSLREVLNDTNASFFEADNSEALARKLQAVASDPKAAEKARMAREGVEEMAWYNRAQSIVNFVCSKK